MHALRRQGAAADELPGHPEHASDFVGRQDAAFRPLHRHLQSRSTRRAASLYEAEHGTKPGKRAEETPTGALRETFAWTRRDLPVFEETWERWYAAQYPQPLEMPSLLAN
ncbi:hypothetical protein AB0B89_29270 [Sphaerisporangium sp. NPDC049002]|uniref:hypothetical protein n=1 Tax=Sphaerisporangium sp. NPDC049002 TaxID=3155392 RepID=UPI0033DA4464